MEQRMEKHPTIDSPEAQRWLARQWAWERRLEQLRTNFALAT
jgi:hypothetical protein